MTNQFSVQRTARLGGALNILSGFPDGFSVFMLRKVFVRGNATATAANILASQTMFRLGCAAELISLVIFVTAMVMLYRLFRRVSRSASLLMLSFAVIGAGIQALDVLCDLTALTLLTGGPTIAALTNAQSQALAFVFVQLHAQVYYIALVFIGFSMITVSYLVFMSSFLPRIIAPLMTIDGLGYVTSSLAFIISPMFASHISPPLPFITALIGEGALMGWLLVKGVNVSRWKQQAADSMELVHA